MKKLILLLIIIFTFGNIVAYAENDFNVRIESKEAKCGETIEVNIKLENNPGTLAMHFDLEYDRERLQLIDAIDNGLIQGHVFSQSIDAYPYIMLWNSASNKNFENDGVLVKLVFKVQDKAESGFANINITYNAENIYNVDLKDIEINVIDGGVNVANDEGNKNTTQNKTETIKSGNSANPKVESTNNGGKISEEKIALDENNIYFDDVKSEDWFFDAVIFANEKKLMVGTAETLFSPNGLVTRAMLVTVLHRMEGEPYADSSCFNDIKSNSWYEQAVNWAYDNNIVNGVSATVFAPDESINREQMVTVMYRYAMFKGISVSDESTDLSSYQDYNNISDYALMAFKWSLSKSIISGKSDSTMNPKDILTRAEMATILMRYIEIII